MPVIGTVFLTREDQVCKTPEHFCSSVFWLTRLGDHDLPACIYLISQCSGVSKGLGVEPRAWILLQTHKDYLTFLCFCMLATFLCMVAREIMTVTDHTHHVSGCITSTSQCKKAAVSAIFIFPSAWISPVYFLETTSDALNSCRIYPATCWTWNC